MLELIPPKAINHCSQEDDPLQYSTARCDNFVKGLALPKQHFSANTIPNTTPTSPGESGGSKETSFLERVRSGVEFHFCYLLAVLLVGKYKELSLSYRDTVRIKWG